MTARTATFLFDLLKLIASAVIGLFAYALVFQLLVGAGMITADIDGDGYGRALTHQAVIVWLVSIIAGFAALFIRADWRWPLAYAPLYAPALYAVIMATAG